MSFLRIVVGAGVALVVALALVLVMGVRQGPTPSAGRTARTGVTPLGADAEAATNGAARLAANFDSAVALAADAARDAIDARGDVTPFSVVRVLPASPESAADQALVRLLRRALEVRGVPVSESDGDRVLSVSREENTVLGSFVRLESRDLRLSMRIAYDMPADLTTTATAGPNDFLVSIQTGPTLSKADSVEDALDAVRRAIENQLFVRLRTRGDLDDKDQTAFLQRFRGRYPRAMLLGQGESRTSTLERSTNGQTYAQTYAVWRSPRHRVERMGEVIASEMRFDRIFPLIQAGLSLGALVLSVLFWLRLDWWLKGHHSLLTKMVCGILALIGVGLIWSWPIHG